MARFAGPENDYRPLAALDRGGPHLTVAVVIPVYNRVELLRRTLAGLMVQRGYPAHLISVVVADDGSEEAAALALAVEEAAERLRITTVRQEREGYGAGRARNLGAAGARADVLLFVDADCLPDPELVAGHMAWHHRADNLVVVGSRQHVDSTRERRGRRRRQHRRPPPGQGRRPARRGLRPGGLAAHLLPAHRRPAPRQRGLPLPPHRQLLAAPRPLPGSRWVLHRLPPLGRRGHRAGLAALLGGHVLRANRATIYHQQQENPIPEGWRRQPRANADLIRSKIPHRYRRLPDQGCRAESPGWWHRAAPGPPS
jgi:hypothetical protein